MRMRYVCIRDGCWNLTTEVLCRKHRIEFEARTRAEIVSKLLLSPFPFTEEKA